MARVERSRDSYRTFGSVQGSTARRFVLTLSVKAGPQRVLSTVGVQAKQSKVSADRHMKIAGVVGRASGVL